jgi:hypothetical protein
MNRESQINRASAQILANALRYSGATSVQRDRIFRDWKIPRERNYASEAIGGVGRMCFLGSQAIDYVPDVKEMILIRVDDYSMRSYAGISGDKPSETRELFFTQPRTGSSWQARCALIRARVRESLSEVEDLRSRWRIVRASLRRVEQTSEALRFSIPTEPEKQAQVFEELLRDLQEIRNPVVLETWLNSIVAGSVTLPEGLPSDSPALALIKRIFQLDPKTGLEWISNLIRRKKGLPFRNGHFQLSLVGVVLANSRRRSFREKLKQWARPQLQRLLVEYSDVQPTSGALLASILATSFLCEEDTVAAAARLKVDVSSALDRIKDPEERRFFLQFLFDALSQNISAQNISDHLLKIIAFCEFVSDEDAVIWPRSGILALIRDNLVSPVQKIAEK